MLSFHQILFFYFAMSNLRLVPDYGICTALYVNCKIVCYRIEEQHESTLLQADDMSYMLLLILCNNVNFQQKWLKFENKILVNSI